MNENSRYIDEILFLYGPSFYDVLSDLKNKLTHIYDTNEIDPINKNIFASLDGLINILRPAKALFEEKNIDTVVNSINESVYNNVQKYNLNVRCINDENVKESIRDYVKGMKMNIINHENSDTDFLDSIKSRGSLINEIFVAVKLVNLSVIFVNMMINIPIFLFLLFFFFILRRLLLYLQDLFFIFILLAV